MSAKPLSDYDRKRAIEMTALRLKPLHDDIPTNTPGYGYQRSLADLVKDMIAPGIDDFFQAGGDGPPDAVEDWTFEAMYMHHAALELRALSRALEAGNATTDDSHLSETFSADDGAALLAIMSRRMVAAAELASRLRVARYGEHDETEGGGSK